jgi:predicted ATP-dependent protease
MLKTEVVEAVAAGKFHVWAIGHVDEAMELLTGVAAGQRQLDGSFEAGTLNARVDQKLRQMMELARELMKREEETGKKSETGAPAPACGR